MIVVSELANGFNVSGCATKSVEYFGDACAWLHGDDTQLIFFIYPNQDSLRLIMENTSARWPISIEVACCEESVTLLEQEVIVDEFLLSGLVHTF